MLGLWAEHRHRGAKYAGLGLAVLAFFFASTTAQAEVAISVAPSFLEFAVDPGTVFDQAITVTNEGSSATGIVAGVRPTPDGLPETSSVDWIEIAPTEFKLGPGESQDVAVHVTVPPDAKPAGRYAAISFRNAPLNVGKGGAQGFFGASGMGAEIAAKFILTVRGPGLTLEGQISRIVPLAVGPSAIGLRVEIANTGNVHMVVSGEVEVTDAAGNVVGTFELPETTAILPGLTKSFKLRGSLQVPPGDYHASGAILYGWTEQQSQAAEVDHADWGERTASAKISFNSVPRLRVSLLQMTSIAGGVKFNLALENQGDVEVVPAGTIDVRNADGQRIIALNIATGSMVVGPRSTVPTERTYNGVIPQGDYDIGAVFDYHGDAFAEASATTAVASDIVPLAVPEAAQFRKKAAEEASPTESRTTLWLIGVWMLLGGSVGIVGALAGLVIGRRVQSAPKQ